MKLELNHEEVMEALAYSLANNSGIGASYTASDLDIIKQPKTGLVTATIELKKKETSDVATEETVVAVYKTSPGKNTKAKEQEENATDEAVEAPETEPEESGSVFAM